MANRYWVGGSGSWNGNHWSGTSGGAGGASVPTAADNVFFDANSGFSSSPSDTRIVQIDIDASCNNMDWTGVTNSPMVTGTGRSLYIYGTLTTVVGMTWPSNNYVYLWRPGSTSFTSNGITFGGTLVFGAYSGGTWTLQDNLTVSGLVILTQGTLNTNGKTVTCGGFYSNYLTSRTLTLGASTFNCTYWNVDYSANFTLNCGTSTINVTGDNQIFAGDGKTYYNVTLTGNNIQVRQSNTFTTLTFTAGKQVNLLAGMTQTVGSLVATGTAGNLITIRSTISGSVSTISRTSGTNTCDFLDLKDCTASGGATWRPGDSSINSGNNSGWSQPWTSASNAYSSNNVYATHTATNGNVYVQLSKDGGTTWQTALLQTFTGSETTKTYGAGSTELWGTSWTGADMDDASFKLRIISQSSDSFNTQVYGSFAFDSEITSSRVLSGIEVTIEAKWDGTTTSVDAIAVRGYSSGSTVPVVEGSLAYITDTDNLVVHDGTSWVPQVPFHGWIGAGETWTYASASTFTVSGDVTAKYYLGVKLRWKQGGGYKYGVVRSSSYSTPNTTVTIVVNTDYTIANSAITDNYSSVTESPAGFPDFFAWAPTQTGFSVAPTAAAKISVHGTIIYISLLTSVAGTSDQAGYYITNLPVTPAVSMQQNCTEQYNNGGSLPDPGMLIFTAASNTLDIRKDLGGVGWTAANGKYVNFSTWYFGTR